jgi:hypothetical protein
MSRVSWGKPRIQFAPVTGANGALGAFVDFPTPVQDSTSLLVEKGNKIEALLEGGETADVRYDRSKYTGEFELYRIKGTQKPITDDDGIIITEYAIRLIPEDPLNEGWIMKRANVSVEDSWAANIGHKWKYTFVALKPAAGKMLEPYSPITPSELSLTSAADTTGKTITVTYCNDVTATSDQVWATVTTVGNAVTVKVTANGTSAERTAVITINDGTYDIHFPVTQAG